MATTLSQKVDALIQTHKDTIKQYEGRKASLQKRRDKDEEGIDEYDKLIIEEGNRIKMLDAIKTFNPEYVNLLKELFK